MNHIIGRVGARVFEKRLEDSYQGNEGQDSPALFRLDKLSPPQIAAIVREIISNAQLSEQVLIRIPIQLVEDEDLPHETMTGLNAGAIRNAGVIGTSKEALLTANGNEHNLTDTLGYVTALGAKEFRGDTEAWVEAVCHFGFTPTPDDRAVLESALKGLISASDLSLYQLADFCKIFIEANRDLGHPVHTALGWSLPCIGLPRDISFFSNSRKFSKAYLPWRKAFQKLFSTRAPLLRRLKPNGQPLDIEEMQQRLDENKDQIQDEPRAVLQDFIRAPLGNESTAKAVALHDWEIDGVHFIFDKPRERQQGIAESTIQYFDHDCTDPDVLDERWREHLEGLKGRERRSDWNEDDEFFFDLHKSYLEKNQSLYLKWEKIIYGNPVECDDFIDGFISVTKNLVHAAGEPTGERSLQFTVSKGRKEWREGFNHDVGSYFSAMYRGLKELMGLKVEWRVEKMGTANLPDPLFQYPDYFDREKEIRRPKPIKRVISRSKKATSIKFKVALIERSNSDDESNVVSKTQLLWKFHPESIGLSLVDDMLRLKEKKAVCCTDVARRLVSKKGGVQNVSLLDSSTLEAIFRKEAGSLVPSATKLNKLKNDIDIIISDLENERRISQIQKKEIVLAWDTFENDYLLALDDFISTGLHGEAVLLQADSYGELLRVLAENARGDLCRLKLVAKILSVGTVHILGGNPALIIPPWHPERMKALAVKTRRAAGIVSYILGNKNIMFGDPKIFFREFSEELKHPFYPEIAVIIRDGSPILVSETGYLNGYSLLEKPVRENDDTLTDVNPVSAAKQIKDLLERFVSLQPHEATNLSVLLYNADAAELPLSVVRGLSDMQFKSNLQCNVSVRHKKPVKLQRIYSELVAKFGDDPDLAVVSETADNFISKLRISVAPSAPESLGSNGGFKPFDIAFLHDVVSRTAIIEWLQVDWTNNRPTLEHAPSRWSYRSISGENELKSTTFLTCPGQTASGWAYVNAVGSVVRQADVRQGINFLPARQISLQNKSLRETIDDAHKLAEWVATYDELLDKRQLQASSITVVRYRRDSTNGRNLIVSSTSELRLLGVLIKRRLSELGLPFNPDEYPQIIERMKKDALTISGDIVLRAAKRGVSAGEMLGLILSRYLIDNEFKTISNVEAQLSFNAYFLLDDYADWLAQKESRIADILGLSVEEGEGILYLRVAVIESKYVSATNLAEARRSSKAQLMATLSTFRAALFGDPGRLDRDIWLSRLSDLLLDADIPPNCSGLLERVRTKLREGDIQISLRGYSHVFVYSSDANPNISNSEQLQLDETEGVEAWQEVFDRPELRGLIQAYVQEEDPIDTRKKLGNSEPWLASDLKDPATRVTWTTMMESLASGVSTFDDEIDYEASVESDDNNNTELNESPVVPTDLAEPLPRATEIPQPDLSNLDQDNHLDSLTKLKVANFSDVVDERGTWAEKITKKLKSALNSYGLQAAILGTRLTPNGCLIRLAGSDRLRVEDIEAKRTQLLTTHAIKLVTVQPKPGEIVISIAGEKRQSISLWDLWSKRAYHRNEAGINTSFVLGVQEINGAPLYLNLGSEFGGLSSHEPHSLVAGATGSGKSVLIQAILLDIAATNPKELAQIILIDPKMGVDYSALGNLPHMRDEIITTRDRATEVLSSLVDEMENRYRSFADVRARDLATFNAKVPIEKRLPMVFLIHDEFADWMLDSVYKTAVSSAVQRLGVKSRAAGIHLIFAAQRPDKDVMPIQLRDNLGNRLILKVASEATSKIVLDRSGAEILLGKGHMAAKLNGEQGLVFAQAPYLSDEDICEAVEAIKQDDVTVN